MSAELLTVDPLCPDARTIAYAAQVLRRGRLVAFPTDTVYGLGANARDPEALAHLAAVKARPQGKPFVIQVPSQEGIDEFVNPQTQPAYVEELMRACWPGPLTIVMACRAGGTVGLRISAHPLTRALLSAAGVPLAVPSANAAGMPAPVRAAEVLAALGERVDLIIDGGPTPLGRESTVLDVSVYPCTILREGALTREELLQIGVPLA